LFNTVFNYFLKFVVIFYNSQTWTGLSFNIYSVIGIQLSLFGNKHLICFRPQIFINSIIYITISINVEIRCTYDKNVSLIGSDTKSYGDVLFNWFFFDLIWLLKLCRNPNTVYSVSIFLIEMRLKVFKLWRCKTLATFLK
jgi:hypothetical protein